jgi:hypothetical protein
MKFLYIFILSTVSISISTAQNITDGLRYSTESNNGSARFTALSGAMGALGGDLSAMSSNPAGGAVFLNSALTLSLGSMNVDNETTYFGHTEKGSENRIDLNQAGGVFIFENFNESSVFKKLTFGVNYQISKNLNNELYLSGIGNTSISEFFLAQAQGVPLDLLETQSGESISSLYQYLGQTSGTGAQNAFLGYQGYLFNPLDPTNPSNTSYVSNVSGNSFNQEYLNLSRGYNAKFTFNVAAQVKDDFYFGINLNTHSINFRQSDYFVENIYTPGSMVNRIGFENNLAVYGAGVSAQIGAIARVAENFRFGVSFDTPTWYQVSEETTQYLETRRIEDGINKTAVVNPMILNVYEDYTLRTPGKLTASAAYVFNQKGLISFDYSYKDYSTIKFTPNYETYFQDLNYDLGNTLKGASVFRAGAEYRIAQLSLRGGFHFEESPYKNTEAMGDLTGFSLGTGYNFGDFNLDFAYARSEQESKYQMYSEGFTDKADVKSVYNNFILSLGFNF